MVKLALPVRSSSSRCMIAGVPGVPVFPFLGLVEVGGKAGVPGLFFCSSRCMIAGVPVGPFFSGSVEACVYGKAGVPGLFFLIQVHDRHFSPVPLFLS